MADLQALDIHEQNKYNPLAQQYSLNSLLRFSFPTIFMMVFTGLYTIVDTVFVSRFVNTDALSSINIVTPIINIIVGLGAALAAGGSAIVARKLGAGRDAEARKDFSLIILTGLSLGLIITIVGLLFLEPITYALGANSVLIPYVKDYLSLLLIFAPANILQAIFAIFFVAAGTPRLGMALALLAGFSNMLFDFIFIVPMQMGIAGAALATGIGYLIQTVGGIVFFLRNTDKALHFIVPHFKIGVIGESLFNGSSEMVGHLSSAVTTFLFNITMMKLLGEDGVAAITIIIYSQFLLSTFYIGFSMGVAPIFSYNYGSQDHTQIKRIFRICIAFIMSVSVLVFSIAMIGGPYLTGIFSPEGTLVNSITRVGFSIVPFAFLFSGLNIFSSALFTAFSNGKISAAVSFLRSLVFLSIGILVLPLLFGIQGVWLAVPLAEVCTFLVSISFIWNKKEKYHYL